MLLKLGSSVSFNMFLYCGDTETVILTLCRCKCEEGRQVPILAGLSHQRDVEARARQNLLVTIGLCLELLSRCLHNKNVGLVYISRTR